RNQDRQFKRKLVAVAPRHSQKRTPRARFGRSILIGSPIPAPCIGHKCHRWEIRSPFYQVGLDTERERAPYIISLYLHPVWTARIWFKTRKIPYTFCNRSVEYHRVRTVYHA